MDRVWSNPVCFQLKPVRLIHGMKGNPDALFTRVNAKLLPQLSRTIPQLYLYIRDKLQSIQTKMLAQELLHIYDENMILGTRV